MDLSGQTLRELRDAAGISQSELARRTGLHQPVLSAYEAGHREPRASAIARIVAGTGHRLAFLPSSDAESLAGVVEELIAASVLDDRSVVWRLLVHSFGRNRWRTLDYGQRVEALHREPRHTGSRRIDALVAGVARWLARTEEIEEPGWIERRAAYLEQRWYPALFSEGDARRELIDEQPEQSFAAFNIWVDVDDLPALERSS